MAADCLNVYPDYDLAFQIYTEASDYQLGAAVIKKEQTVAYWSRLLKPTQQKSTTTEKELLAIFCV